MSDALTRAFAEADAMQAMATKAAGSLSGMLTSSGIPYSMPNLGTHAEQLRHNKGWAYCANRAIAQRIASQDLFVARPPRSPAGRKALGDVLEPLASHPLLDAIDNPNPLMTRWSMMVSTVSALELCGRAYWWWSPLGSQGEIWPLPPTWVQPANNLRTGWKVRPFGSAEEIDVPGDEIAHFCLPDPSDPFKALSPLQTQASAVATDESIQTAQFRSFKNGNFPQLLIRAGRLPGTQPGQPGDRPVLEPEQRKELISAIQSICRGAVNFNEPLILDGLIEGVDKLSTAPGEMDFLNSGNAVKSRILQAFGVNPAIVGQLEGANRASTFAAEEHFCKSTVNPLIELMSQTLTKWASALWGEKLAVWIDPCVPHDDELWQRQIEFGCKMGFIDGNEYRTMLNLPARTGLDVLLDPFSGQARQSAQTSKNLPVHVNGSRNGHSGRFVAGLRIPNA